MNVKMFEVRDNATCIPVIAIKLERSSMTDQEAWLAKRAGYGDLTDNFYVIVMKISDGQLKACYDPFGWNDNGSTMFKAQEYITENFDNFNTGDVVDVRVYDGRAAEPVQSDRWY